MLNIIFKNFKIKKNAVKGLATSLSSGFTMIETLIAILILAMSITATMTVASSSLQASFYARDKIAAYFLAQEAIEMIKNKRDENGIANYTAGGGVHWLENIVAWDGLGGDCGPPNQFSQPFECGVDSLNDEIVRCNLNSDCLLYRGVDSGILQHSADSNFGLGLEQVEATKFSRKIRIEEVNDDEIKITVTVTWPGRSFTVTEHILNWHPLSDCLNC